MSAPASAPVPRRRRWPRYLALGALSVLLLAGVLLLWLLRSEGGREFALGQVLARLDAEQVGWQRSEGRLVGPLVLYGVYWQDADGLRVEVERLRVDVAPSALASRHLRLEAVEATRLRVLLAPAAETPAPAEPFQWPPALPVLDLPLRISLAQLVVDGVRIEDATGGEALVLERVELAGDLTGPRLDLTRLVATGDIGRLDANAAIDTAADWRTAARADWRNAPGAPAVGRLALRLDGDLEAFALDLEGEAPEPLRLRVALSEGRRAPPHWTLSLDAEGLDPAVFGVEDLERVRARLEAAGEGGAFGLEGELGYGEHRLDIAPSRLELHPERLAFAPLDLRLLDGALRLDGDLALSAEAPAMDLRAALDGLRWQPDPQAPATEVDGELALQGLPEDWTVEGRLDLARDGQRGEVRLAGAGDTAHLRLDRLAVRTAGGRLDGSGVVHWDPHLAWELQADLRGLDPSWLAPDFPGAIDGRLVGRGELREDRLQLEARLDSLAGQLRGRALGGRAMLDWRGEAGELEADLRIGASHLRGGGRIDPRGHDLRVALDPLQLADVLPDAEGRLQGELSLRGPNDALGIRADLDGESLASGEARIGRLRIAGRLSPRDADGSLRADLADLVLAGLALETAELELSGSPADARLGLSARGEPGVLSLSADLAQAGSDWRGRLLDLRYAPPIGSPWSLVGPADFALGGERFTLASACLGSGTARLCAEADWPRMARVTGRELPLALLDPWLADDGVPLTGYGQLALDARLAQGRDGLQAEFELAGTVGGVRLEAGDGTTVFGYRELALTGRLLGERVEMELDSRLDDGGRIEARLATGLAADAALDAELRLAMDDLTWLELFSPDIVRPVGQLRGDLRLSGTRADPQVQGEARLTGFGTELPALGITLREGEIHAGGDERGRFRLDGRLRSGEGELALEGRMRQQQDALRFILRLRGENVLVSDTPDLRAVVSPDINIAYANERLRVRGTVEVPSARIDLERLDTTTSPSPDVVVLDPIDPVTGPPVPLDLQLTIALGERVELVGFGLEGRLGGQLRVRQLPGQAATASGALNVSGVYKAYGRELEITRGRLSWANAPVDNPALDISAQRKFDEVTVGLRVRGTALRPESEIFSDPAMESTEALSWLVLGRPLRSAGADESQQLGAAAMALGAGGNLVAQQIGARLGLDEAGVGESRALGGAAFTVGKFLSPRLFVSYGVSLLGTGQVLTLKYLLGRGFDIQIESGVESRGSINWRLER